MIKNVNKDTFIGFIVNFLHGVVVVLAVLVLIVLFILVMAIIVNPDVYLEHLNCGEVHIWN